MSWEDVIPTLPKAQPPPTDEQIVAKIQAELSAGRLWGGMKVRHVKSGGKYNVVCVAKVEATLDPVVVYRSLKDHDAVWTRPLAEFCDGRFVAV
jgi:hypothetical protein